MPLLWNRKCDNGVCAYFIIWVIPKYFIQELCVIPCFSLGICFSGRVLACHVRPLGLIPSTTGIKKKKCLFQVLFNFFFLIQERAFLVICHKSIIRTWLCPIITILIVFFSMSRNWSWEKNTIQIKVLISKVFESFIFFSRPKT